MSDIVSINANRPLDRDGITVPGALAYFYLSGTTTPQVVYTTAAGDVAHPIPLEADANGVFPPIFSGVALKVIVTDASGVTLPGFPIDPVIKVGPGSGASQISFEPTPAVPESNVQAAIEFLSGGLSAFPIGLPFPLWDHLTGVNPPSNAGSVKFIKLTAGESGLGEYNSGLLINESVSGSAPNIVATAEIATGALAGAVINLINTEGRFLRPGETSGALQDGQNLSHTHTGTTNNDGSHTHTVRRNGNNTAGTDTSGFAANSFDGNNNGPITTDGSGAHQHNFTTASSGGNEARPRNIAATYYMRIE